MEDYSQLSENTSTWGSFLYAAPAVAPNSSSTSVYGRSNNGGSNVNNHQQQQPPHLPINTFHLQSGESFLSEAPPIVKTEASSSHQVQEFHYSLLRGEHQTVHHHDHDHQQQHQQGGNGSSNEVEAIKAKIIAHPRYSNLLEAYMDCQKVGAPAEVVNRLTDVRREFETRQKSSVTCGDDPSKDPELDKFMEAYYDMLVKYREELTRPLQEAMEFMRRVEAQLKTLSNGPLRIFTEGKSEGFGSSEDDQENSGGEMELPEIDPRSEDRDLKNHLLKKYSGYLSSLKQELSKKKKKGKLPKDARQKLLNWWELHYKWPYPSETEKVALATSTGLDQKQINNWFINQRKRHWKPSEDMQFVVMDGLHHQNAALYMDGHFMGDGNYRLGP